MSVCVCAQGSQYQKVHVHMAKSSRGDATRAVPTGCTRAIEDLAFSGVRLDDDGDEFFEIKQPHHKARTARVAPW